MKISLFENTFNHWHVGRKHEKAKIAARVSFDRITVDSIIKWKEHVMKTTWPVASDVPTTTLKWRRLLSRRFNSSRVPSPRYFTATMLANYRQCITIPFLLFASHYEASFLSPSLDRLAYIWTSHLWMRSDAWKRNTRRWRET